MPFNAKLYPANWKTEIRPAILKRADNKCEICGVKNHETILRGEWKGEEAFQDMDGSIFRTSDGKHLGDDYCGEVCPNDPDKMCVKVVLTIAHLNHDTADNRPENLKALCQLHHLRTDHDLHRKNAAETRRKKKGIIEIEF